MSIEKPCSRCLKVRLVSDMKVSKFFPGVVCVDRPGCTRRLRRSAIHHYRDDAGQYCDRPTTNNPYDGWSNTSIDFVSCKACILEYRSDHRTYIRERLEESARSGVGSIHRRLGYE